MEAFDKFKQLPFTTITFRQKRLRRNLRASGEDREITTAEIEPAPWVNANDAHYRLIKRFRFLRLFLTLLSTFLCARTQYLDKAN